MKILYSSIMSIFLFCAAVTAQNKKMAYEEGSTAGLILESALKVDINNAFNFWKKLDSTCRFSGDANGIYFMSSAVERFRLYNDGRVMVGGITNRYSKLNVLGGINTDSLKSNNYTSLSGPTYFNYAPDFSPYVNGVDRIYVMKSDGELRSKNLRDLLNDIVVNDTFALTGTAGGVFNLSSTATTVVDLGVYTNSISTNSTIEFRLASGAAFYDNQQITVMSTKNMTCGQGVKIRLADSGGTSLVQLCNDILSLLTEEYEFASNPLQKFTLTFQYSKKRNKWRIVNFKEWGDL